MYIYCVEENYPYIEGLNPRTCISGKMNRCNRIIANVFRKHLSTQGVTSSQLSILFLAAKISPLSQKKITETLFLEKSSVNRNIKRLVENEWLAVIDRKLLTITTQGKERLEQVIPVWNNAMTEINKVLEAEGLSALNMVEQKLSEIK